METNNGKLVRNHGITKIIVSKSHNQMHNTVAKTLFPRNPSQHFLNSEPIIAKSWHKPPVRPSSHCTLNRGLLQNRSLNLLKRKEFYEKDFRVLSIPICQMRFTKTKHKNDVKRNILKI